MLNCKLCPKKCGANRQIGRGLCGAGVLKAARAAPHYYEEPCISGKNGSGAIFFSGCPLKCVFCQNYDISAGCEGTEITVARLTEIMLELQDRGCHNISLVSPTPYVPEIIKALKIAKLKIPVVYNTSGYERVETLKALDGYIDVYLPDFKYVTPEISEKYSGASDYPTVAAKALSEMLRQRGGCEFDGDGMMTRGVIVRHLVLPSNKGESVKTLEYLSENYDKSKFLLSLMAQYVPVHRASEYKEINRRLTKYEYKKAAGAALSLGFTGYFQDPSSQDSAYTPKFDGTGI